MVKGERFNSISHLVGASFALVGGAVLITSASLTGGVLEVVSYSIYAVTLFLLYLFSTLYHAIPGRAKVVLRVLDHQAIYLLIAGTYTPFILLALQGATRWWMLAIMWSIALVGIVNDAFPKRGPRIVPVVLYLAMGWAVVIFPDSFWTALGEQSLGWLIGGGVFYTSGVIFYALDRWYPWCHEIWHLFVIAGSACHYVSITLL